MFKKYMLNRLLNVTAWIGLFIILSVWLLPDFVTLSAGLWLMVTPDDKLNSIVRNLLPKFKKFLDI